jgi:serine/threonine-protein kinase
MGEVWRADHLGLRAPIAIKLMNPSIISDQDALARFNREAQAAAALRSPHVVQVFDHGVDPDTGAPFIAMELMEGESLAHRLARLGPLPAVETARVVTHVARALARAHEIGIVHRDLKPDNIFLVRNEDEEIAKVLDFGIAKTNAQALGPGSATRTGTVMGTPYYMSPEQITGAKGLDYRTDLWALGVIACECLTGKQPFEGETIGALVLAICTMQPPRPSSLAAVPDGFDAWFARATDRDIAARFQSARELADALRQLTSTAAPLAAQPAGAPPGARTVDMLPGTAGFTVKPVYHTQTDASAEPAPERKRGAGLFVSGLLASLVVLGGASWFLFFSGSGSTNVAAAEGSAATSAPSSLPAVSAPSLPSPTPAASVPAVNVAPVVNVAPASSAGNKSPPAKSAPAARPPAASPRPAVPVAPTPAPAAPPKPPSDSGSVFDRRKG